MATSLYKLDQQTALQRRGVSLPAQGDNQVTQVLRSLGAVTYDLRLPETKLLSQILYDDERVVGIVWGQYHELAQNLSGRGALVATNKRVLLVDKKPFFVRSDQLMYAVVSGVTYSKVGVAGTVTLHTRMGDISRRTYNQQCAFHFVRAIERNIISSSKEIL